MEKPGQSWTEKTKLRHNVSLSSIVIPRNFLNSKQMKITERATLVDHELAKLYPNPPIPLDHEDSYTLLIAVLLSAQCTDARVNKITPNLFKLASNPLSMSQLSVDEINTIVRPCGLSPRKAKAIPRSSSMPLETAATSNPAGIFLGQEHTQVPGQCESISLRTPCPSVPVKPLQSQSRVDFQGISP